jgi:hypothetical protein
MAEKPDLNCANAKMAGNLEAFYAEIRVNVNVQPQLTKVTLTVSEYLFQLLEVVAQLILMREAVWPKLMVVEVMSVSKYQQMMVVLMLP